MIHGQGIKPGRLEQSPSVLDVTPTILYLSGIPIALDMPGQPIMPALDPKYFPAPTSSAKTYESPDKPKQSFKPMSSEVDEDIIEKLKSLGYVK